MILVTQGEIGEDGTIFFQSGPNQANQGGQGVNRSILHSSIPTGGEIIRPATSAKIFEEKHERNIEQSFFISDSRGVCHRLAGAVGFPGHSRLCGDLHHDRKRQLECSRDMDRLRRPYTWCRGYSGHSKRSHGHCNSERSRERNHFFRDQYFNGNYNG